MVRYIHTSKPSIFPHIRSFNEVKAYLKGKVIGELWWHIYEDDGAIIECVEVKKTHRRKGIATTMFNLAIKVSPNLKHDTNLSEDANKWKKHLDLISKQGSC